MNKENHIGRIIKQKRDEKKLSLRDLALLTNVSHQYLNLLERGYDQRTGRPVSPTLEVLRKISKGLDIPMEEFFEEELDCPGAPPGTFRLNRKNICMVPVISRISAGDPQEPKKPTDLYWPVDMRLLKAKDIDLNTDSMYYLEVEGDSMQPIFNNGDYILVSGAAEVKAGNIAVVIVNGHEACLRKVHFQGNDLVVLLSRNPKYEPLIVNRDACEIKGKVLLRVGEPKWW